MESFLGGDAGRGGFTLATDAAGGRGRSGEEAFAPLGRGGRQSRKFVGKQEVEVPGVDWRRAVIFFR